MDWQNSNAVILGEQHSIFLSAIYGSVDAAFISWFTAKERAEQREL